MSRLFFLIFIATLFYGCSKTEDNIIWEGSFGKGKALCVKIAGDSGYVSAGMVDGKPYLLFLDNNKSKVLEYNPDVTGSITSVWPGEGFFLAGGSSGGKMLLSKINMSGSVVWDSLFNTTFRIDHTSLCWLGGQNYLAVGSADPDSSVAASSGISFVWFTTSGDISSRKDEASPSFTAAKAAATDNQGNIYLGLSRKATGGNLKASVAKYNNLARMLWEEELYNNPSFGAASLGITLDGSANPVVTGRTGMQVSSGIEINTFVARYIYNGDLLTKNYLEYSNAGSSILPDGTGGFYALNMNCLIINILNQDLESTGIIRTFSTCDSKSTDSFGYSMDHTSDGNLIMAGSKGNRYYLAIKSKSALSPV